jgi:integrase
MSTAWIFQEKKQVLKHGEKGASWYVGFYSPDGKRRWKSCGAGSFGRIKAEKLRKKIEAELLTGTFQSAAKTTWADFREQYEAKVLSGLAPRSRDEAITALDHFQRIAKPARLVGIKTQTIDQYITERRLQPGKKKGDSVSPATINKELRHVKAALRVAHEWGFMPVVPKFRMERQPLKLPTYVTGEDFARIYNACDSAKFPHDQPYAAADWWRALVTFGYMTGWRISEILALRREDLDLEAGTAVTRAEDNKGKRDERIKLHPVVLEHLKRVAGFDVRVFPWNLNRRTLQTEFARIQEAAGIKLPCPANHEHTRYCFVHGFHDLRRAFATMNADKLTADALQTLMRHKSYLTTKIYINMARQMDAAVAGLHVPDVLRVRAEG